MSRRKKFPTSPASVRCNTAEGSYLEDLPVLVLSDNNCVAQLPEALLCLQLLFSIKYPKNTYPYLQFLVSHKYDSEAVRTHQRWFLHHELSEHPDTGTVLFKQNEEVYSPEELLGMIFNSSRQILKTMLLIKDVVITVPPFFTMTQ
ncbi:hypoxia up-regulated protein 1-like [Dysidea avara]|uniref:hypoxia up-regulated protein 1-like n=1 Tax=Dysidea avara TaxID=196820 RepID=UPI00332E6165